VKQINSWLTLVSLAALGVAVGLAPPALAEALPAGARSATGASKAMLPVVTPTPQSMSRPGADTALPAAVDLVVTDTTDQAARAVMERTLREHRVTVTVRATAQPGSFSVLLGPATRPDITATLGSTVVPDRAEGYALRVDAAGARIAIGGVDGSGQYYGVQTLRQLIMPGPANGRDKLPGVSVSDYPAMPLRGTIEGFYGDPWTREERLDQLATYGEFKANTYIYAPKDDPYHRQKWREPYPADKLAELTELAQAAAEHHVHFTFALSPGNTICYSSDADYQAIAAKFAQMYAVGVRSFNIPFDDITLNRWSCEGDSLAYGLPGAGAAGRAQADFLTRVQREFIETHPGAQPLQMVPTEYANSTDSPYKAALRQLDEDVIVMWTGNAVVPPSISVEQAKQAATVFGGPTFLWDNYPVNDYGNAAGRLLLAPYDKREAGLSAYLSGIVSNPMNQAAASKIAIVGVADYTWNDTAYDAQRTWIQAMRYLSGGNGDAVEALTVFADLNHLAPSFGKPWQPQAPALQARIDAFWAALRSGSTQQAITDLRAYAARIAAAPATIRAGAVEPGFTSDAGPWLDATEKWGRALLLMLDALQDLVDGDRTASDQRASESDAIASQAASIVVDPPENTWGRAPVKIADGVLDTFLAKADLTRRMWDIRDAVNVAPQGVASASSVLLDISSLFGPANVNDANPSTLWAASPTDTEWVQVKLAQPTVVRGVTVSWHPDLCPQEYKIETSVDGQAWTTVKDVTASACGVDVVVLPEAPAVSYVRMQGVQLRPGAQWGYPIWELGIYANQ
jgi:hyaluronoglucosaminidase